MNRFVFAQLAVGAVATVGAQSFYASTDKFGYTGVVTRYNTLSDAQSETNGQGTFDVSQRDAGIYFVNNRPSFDVDSNIFLTAWWYTTQANTNGFPMDDPSGDRYYSGWGNPNNTDNSFVQLYDDNGDTDVFQMAGWTSNAHDTFLVHVDGVNAMHSVSPDGNDYTRFWNAGDPDVGAEGTKGDFINYSFDLMAYGLVSSDTGGGFFESSNHPTHIEGSFTGIFQNVSTTSPISNGFYKFSLTFNDTNWAFSQGDAALNGDFSLSGFGAGAAPVPEPATMAALGMGAIALLRKRRKL